MWGEAVRLEGFWPTGENGRQKRDRKQARPTIGQCGFAAQANTSNCLGFTGEKELGFICSICHVYEATLSRCKGLLSQDINCFLPLWQLNQFRCSDNRYAGYFVELIPASRQNSNESFLPYACSLLAFTNEGQEHFWVFESHFCYQRQCKNTTLTWKRITRVYYQDKSEGPWSGHTDSGFSEFHIPTR